MFRDSTKVAVTALAGGGLGRVSHEKEVVEGRMVPSGDLVTFLRPYQRRALFLCRGWQQERAEGATSVTQMRGPSGTPPKTPLPLCVCNNGQQVGGSGHFINISPHCHTDAKRARSKRSLNTGDRVLLSQTINAIDRRRHLMARLMCVTYSRG